MTMRTNDARGRGSCTTSNDDSGRYIRRTSAVWGFDVRRVPDPRECFCGRFRRRGTSSSAASGRLGRESLSIQPRFLSNSPSVTATWRPIAVSAPPPTSRWVHEDHLGALDLLQRRDDDGGSNLQRRRPRAPRMPSSTVTGGTSAPAANFGQDALRLDRAEIDDYARPETASSYACTAMTSPRILADRRGVPPRGGDDREGGEGGCAVVRRRVGDVFVHRVEAPTRAGSYGGPTDLAAGDGFGGGLDGGGVDADLTAPGPPRWRRRRHRPRLRWT